MRASGTPLVWLDAGDLLFPRVRSPYDSAARLQSRAEFVLASHARLGLDAFCPSLSDLRLGLQALVEQARKAGLTLLAANLEAEDGRPLPITPRLTRELGGVRVGLFGLVGPGRAPGARILDAVAAARREVAALRAEAELIVCLSNQGIEADSRLAAEVEGIHFILGAGDDRMVLRPRRVDDSLLLQPYKKGEYLGLVRLRLDGAPGPLADEVELEDLERKVARGAADGEPERLARLRGQGRFRAVLRPLTEQDPEEAEMHRAVLAQLAREAELP